MLVAWLQGMLCLSVDPALWSRLNKTTEWIVIRFMFRPSQPP